uniref:B-cell receptor CD22-like n=1 Tax=Semicossyphus pulcher TaxID=241346 RepID=UPI0037E82A5A
MAAALTLLLIGCLLQGALCGEFEVTVPQTIEVLRGSCVTIPCSFDIPDIHQSNLDSTCIALWKDGNMFVFDSSTPQQSQITGTLTGDLLKKDCTTTLNNMQPHPSNNYYFKLQCNNALKYTFSYRTLSITFTDNPPRPTLNPSTLKVKEGTSVTLTCSGRAPCLSLSPTLTWTPGLGEGQETLRENQDKTKIKTSVVKFTASHLHHKQEISCTAVYKKQDGSTESSVKTSITADISFSPKGTTVSVRPSGPVQEDQNVTLTCSSSANPAVKNYTWYGADGGRETFVGTGRDFKIKASQVSGAFFCKAENDLGAGRSNNTQIDVQYSPKGTTVSVRPSGPVQEGSIVTLTCSSSANPAVKNYTWYGADGGRETFVGTGRVFKMKASQVSGPFFCKAENDLGAGRSNNTQIDVQYPEQLFGPYGGVLMAAALTLLLIGCLLQGALCGQFEVTIPQTIEVLRGSCVTIPCSFDIRDEHQSNLDSTCIALWKDGNMFVFDSSAPQQSQITGTLTGDLMKKDCTTTLNNMQPHDSNNYYFRLQCGNRLKYNFDYRTLSITFTDNPPRPTLNPSTLKVKEGTSVTLTCSARAPCLSLSPTLTWTPGLGEGQETLRENQDKTKIKTSVVKFTASHLHHKQEISCTAVYKKQDGSTESSVKTSITADISYSPKGTTVSVRPSGPVQEGSIVTLTCSSSANPAVKNYTWYRADGGRETFVGTGRVFKMKASQVSGPFFCKAENDLGAGRSNNTQIDVQFAPNILPSSVCTQTAAQVKCSCETSGNPPPSLHWYLKELPVNHSDKSAKTYMTRNGTRNDTGLSVIVVNQPQLRDHLTLLCRSSNSLGSATQRFYIYSLESTETRGYLLFLIFFPTTVTLLALICALLFVIRAQKTQNNLLKSQCSGNTSTVAMSQLLPSGEGNEIPNTTDENIYANSTELRQANVVQPANLSEPNCINLPSSGPNNPEEENKSLEMRTEESKDVIYTTVTWRSKNKRKEEEGSGDMDLSGCREKCKEGELRADFMNNALEMGNIYEEVKPRNVKMESECQYAPVKFKDKSEIQN